jgi:hypothetical protein
MTNPSWLKKLSPSELQLLRDLADVVARTALSGRQDMMTAEIRQDDGRDPTRARAARQNRHHFASDAGNTQIKAVPGDLLDNKVINKRLTPVFLVSTAVQEAF